MGKGPGARRIVETMRYQRKANVPELRAKWVGSAMGQESWAGYRLSDYNMRPQTQWLKQDGYYEADQEELINFFSKGPV